MSREVEAVARAFKRTAADTRALLADLEAEGYTVVYRETFDLCPCGYHYATESGLCLSCEAKEEERVRAEEIVEESKRLEEEFGRMRNKLKTALKRERERFFAKPRDASNRERWRIARELIADIEESLNRDSWEGDDTGWEEVDE